MSLERYASLLDMVPEEVNTFIIFSKGLQLLDLATPLFVTRCGGTTKLKPHHLLHQFMLDSFVNEVFKPRFGDDCVPLKAEKVNCNFNICFFFYSSILRN